MLEEWWRILKIGMHQWADWISGLENAWNYLTVFLRLLGQIKSKQLFGKSQPSQTKDIHIHILSSSGPTDFWRCFWIVAMWESFAMSKLKGSYRNRTFYSPEAFWGGRQPSEWNQAKVHFLGKVSENVHRQWWCPGSTVDLELCEWLQICIHAHCRHVYLPVPLSLNLRWCLIFVCFSNFFSTSHLLPAR